MVTLGHFRSFSVLFCFLWPFSMAQCGVVYLYFYTSGPETLHQVHGIAMLVDHLQWRVSKMLKWLAWSSLLLASHSGAKLFSTSR